VRGRFIREDGLIIPNNISLNGAKIILGAAFRNDVPTFYVALVQGTPEVNMTIDTMTEPTFAIGGYSRIAVARSPAGWPVEGNIGNERYIESSWLEWIATGAGFNQPVQRLALVGLPIKTNGETVYALSSPLPTLQTILPTTPQASRRFKYQVFL
jgi:hypothetical protein